MKVMAHFGSVSFEPTKWDKIAEIRNRFAHTDFYYKDCKRRGFPIVIAHNPHATTKQLLAYSVSRWFSHERRFPDGFRILNTYRWMRFVLLGRG